MKNIAQNYKKIITTLIIVFTILPITTTFAKEVTSTDNEIIVFNQEFSTPEINDQGENIEIVVPETNAYTTYVGMAKLPVFTKTFELPVGTDIENINCEISDIKTITLEKEVQLVEPFQVSIYTMNYDAEQNRDLYPSDWYSIKRGVGLGKDGEYVTYLTISVYPVRYSPFGNKIEYIENFEITIEHSRNPSVEIASTNLYDLVIISPSEFYVDLQPLIEHKENMGVKTNLTVLDDIYGSYPGRDEAEQIKYFIKYAVENWGIKYVLLVGDVWMLPIREVGSHFWSSGEGPVLSDLYYADIYDENFSFCSWDGNDNDVFGEVNYTSHYHNYSADNIDKVDLYPDVYIGRLPCSDDKEVDLVVDKIITYEEETYNKIWFKRIILAGGDTFPIGIFPIKNPSFGEPNVFEGEITNIKVAQQLPDFEHITLWATKHNLNALTFNRAINKGAGFLSYAGHGFEFGWGTFRPNSLSRKLSLFQPFYNSVFVNFLKNDDKLTIIFFDACLTAKLDCTLKDLTKYKSYSFLEILTRLPDITEETPIPCFAWKFIKHENGGAIATIGATRSAYTFVDKDGVYGGAGYLDFQFFKQYYEGVKLGEMLGKAQVAYINNVGRDFFTVEEFLLLGDPSLMVGGYP